MEAYVFEEKDQIYVASSQAMELPSVQVVGKLSCTYVGSFNIPYNHYFYSSFAYSYPCSM